MVKTLLVVLLLSSILGAGTVGAIIVGSSAGQIGEGQTGPRGYGCCPMMDGDDFHAMQEECEEHMGNETAFGSQGDLTPP